MRTKSFAFATIFVTAFAIMAVLVSGCSKDEQQGNFTPNEELSVEEKNANIELLGQAFGSALAASPELRALVWAEAQKQVTHDYDVPFLLIRDMDVGGVTVAHLVEAKLKAIAPKVDLETLVNSLHYVQLTIPLHQVKGWDAAVVPSVAVYPIGVGQKELVELVGFSPGGQRTAFCAREEPTEPVVVVRESDRIDRQGRLTVNRHGLGLGEIGRKCVREARVQNEIMLKPGKVEDEEPLIHIISEDSLARLRTAHELEQQAIKTEEALLMERFEAEHGNRLKSTQNMVINSLTSFTNQPRAIALSWTHVGGSGVVYKVYAAGNFSRSGLFGGTEFRSKQLISTTSSLNATCNLPFSYQTYNLWVEGERNGTVISTSNYVTIFTSARANNCTEFPSKISMTASVMRELEGWAANKLELRWHGVFVQSDGKAKTITQGEKIYFPHYSWGVMQDTERTYTSASFRLFEWNRYEFNLNGYNSNNGAYTILWYEFDWDGDGKSKLIACQIVRFISSNTFNSSTNTSVKLLREAVEFLVNVEFKTNTLNEWIGEPYVVNWWTPNGSNYFPKGGVVIEHSFQNP